MRLAVALRGRGGHPRRRQPRGWRLGRCPFGTHALRLGPACCAAGEPVQRQLLELDGSEFRQDPGIENILCPAHGGRALFGEDLGEIVLHGVRDAVGAFAHHAPAIQPLPLAAAPGVLLGLPVVEHLDAVGAERVIGDAERLGGIGAGAG
jgi:hypothetical protein